MLKFQSFMVNSAVRIKKDIRYIYIHKHTAIPKKQICSDRKFLNSELEKQF